MWNLLSCECILFRCCIDGMLLFVIVVNCVLVLLRWIRVNMLRMMVIRVVRVNFIVSLWVMGRLWNYFMVGILGRVGCIVVGCWV